MSQVAASTEKKSSVSIWSVVALLVVAGFVMVLAFQLRARNATQPTSGAAPDLRAATSRSCKAAASP